MNTEMDSLTITMIVVLALLFGSLLTAKIVQWVRFARGELNYINMELKRCSSRERKYWKREKRRVWMNILFGRR